MDKQQIIDQAKLLPMSEIEEIVKALLAPAGIVIAVSESVSDFRYNLQCLAENEMTKPSRPIEEITDDEIFQAITQANASYRGVSIDHLHEHIEDEGERLLDLQWDDVEATEVEPTGITPWGELTYPEA